jgi:predicted RNase H-like HicB family nuclease
MDTHAKAEELANRPYIVTWAIEETTDNQPIYFARALELEGCFGQGDSSDAAIEDLRLAMVDFIESLLEDDLPVPEPTSLKPTIGTATQGAFTFKSQGKGLKPKQDETYLDAYYLSVQV